MITLNVRDVLVAARKAWDAGELQAQTHKLGSGSGCFYAGPCAVGVALTPEQRERFDQGDEAGYVRIAYLRRAGFFETDDIAALSLLQNRHDDCLDPDLDEAGLTAALAKFGRTLTDLEAKHGLTVAA